MIKLACLTAAALLSVSLPGSALAATLYSQPSDGTVCDTSCLTSTGVAVGPTTVGYQTFDDFSLSSDATVTAASWFGFYSESADGPNPATTTDWQIGFYADDGTLPGAELYSTSIAAASVTTQFLGDVNAFGNNVSFYEFTAALPTGFNALGATTYWFSPLSQEATSEPIFAWSPSNTGDGQEAQLTLLDGALSDQSGDSAFVLSGTTAAPEPATWALMLAGVLGAGAALRVRRRYAAPAIA